MLPEKIGEMRDPRSEAVARDSPHERKPLSDPRIRARPTARSQSSFSQPDRQRREVGRFHRGVTPAAPLKWTAPADKGHGDSLISIITAPSYHNTVRCTVFCRFRRIPGGGPFSDMMRALARPAIAHSRLFSSAACRLRCGASPVAAAKCIARKPQFSQTTFSSRTLVTCAVASGARLSLFGDAW